MSKLLTLKSAKTLADVASLLGFSASGLSFVLYKQLPELKYAKFEIPKANGGTRQICAPLGAIKAIQRELATLLNECRAELLKAKPRRPISHGFRESLSIITNAQNHKKRRFVLNVDLADFFPAFNFGRVRGFFLKDEDFILDEKVATVLAQIACFENALPQGSPCSPVIADMIGHVLDTRLVRLAKKHGVTYSRYADDLTFSTNRKTFPTALASGGAGPETPWILGAPLLKVIEWAGFKVNSDKTRMQIRGSRQIVTGLTVNEKVNVSQAYWRTIRSMCHALFEYGEYHFPAPSGITDSALEPLKLVSLDPLAGMLSHAYNVKTQSGRFPNEKTKDNGKAEDVVFGQTVHERFWFYKYFVALNRPLIVCEGATDNIYLRNAIRRLTNYHPQLGAQTTSGFKFAVALFSYANKVHKILGLKGGIGHLKALTSGYRKRLRVYKHLPMSHPVIILVDNDSGLSQKFCNELKKNFGADVTHLSNAPFFHLIHNLYLVKTPGVGTEVTSCIEDLFDETTKLKELDGKCFHIDKDFDSTKHIGKAPFATKIVAPLAAEISWAGFAPLLDRIVAVLNDYALKTSSGLPMISDAATKAASV